MTLGTRESQWSIGFHPTTGDHLSWAPARPRSAPWSPGPPTKPASYRFCGTLEFADYSRGRSSTTVLLRDIDTGTNYSMFLAEFMRLVPELVGGKLSGEWGFVKNGSNTGVARCEG